jgi:ribosomal protein S18 acetylase RimI-like enzyme
MSNSSEAQMKTGNIRPLSADDLEAVISIDTSHTGTSRRGFFEKRLKAALSNPRDYVYVALSEDNRLVGYAMAKIVEGAFGKPGGRAAFDAIGVDSGCQDQGIGHQLISAVEEILKHKGVHELTSQVGWSDLALIGFLGEAGFALASDIVLSRSTTALVEDLDFDAEEPLEIDYSSPEGDSYTALSRDKVPVRSMKDDDIDAIISIDWKNSGVDRSSYFKRKQHEVMHQSGIRVSLVAEMNGYPAGFIMARIDFGEFGRTSAEAVMDAIGVNPGYQGQGVGQALMSQLMANLSVLQADRIRTEIAWNDVNLISFLDGMGFEPAQYVALRRNLTA